VFGPRPPQSDSIWDAARQRGFEVVVEDCKARNREARIAASVTAAMMYDAITALQNQKVEETEMILVAGDCDYEPVVKTLINRGFKVTVCFWGHAADELKNAASEFVLLDPYVDQLRR